MMKQTHPLISLLCALTGSVLLSGAAQAQPRPATREEIITDLVAGADSTYAAISTPGKKFGVRNLFTAMLAYAEANTNLTRIAELLLKAEALQERNPALPRYGNFYWYSTETEVLDANAVDFCMQHAALLWMFHRERLDPSTRARFQQLITLGLEGLLRHRPSPEYTNIALLNASDLILLGQALQNPAAVEEGRHRLRIFILTLWEQGTREYVSPTYYGINLESALLLEALALDPPIRQSAAAIRLLFETDTALNRQNPRAVLSGTCSRTYDYLCKQGELDQILVPFGWLANPRTAQSGRFSFRFFSRLYTRHLPSPATLALSEQFPRTVTQSWGFAPRSTRIHYLCADVSLSTSASIYGQMDIPLSVDLPPSAEASEVQLYFLPDGREDPYGKNRIAAGNHSKALHLTPWWAATQDKNSALTLVLYHPPTLKQITAPLQSQIVFRRELDALYIDSRRIDPAALRANPEPLHSGQSLFLREGSAAVAIQIPWAQGQGAAPAVTTLIDDGNRYGALRLSTDHPIRSLDENSALECAGTLLRVQTGSGIRTDQQFEEFRQSFTAAGVTVTQRDGTFTALWNSGEQELSIAAVSLTAPSAAVVTPRPSMQVLALDGVDIGRRILEESPFVREYLNARRAAIPIEVAPAAPTLWSALDGASTVPFETGEEQGKKYLWVAESEGSRAWNAGALTWELTLKEPGRFALEAEVLAPTPDDDSFFVSALDPDGNEIIAEFAWSTGTGAAWRWSRVINRDSKPYQELFSLPAGKNRIVFRTREAGIRLSQLRLLPQ